MESDLELTGLVAKSGLAESNDDLSGRLPGDVERVDDDDDYAGIVPVVEGVIAKTGDSITAIVRSSAVDFVPERGADALITCFDGYCEMMDWDIETAVPISGMLNATVLSEKMEAIIKDGGLNHPLTDPRCATDLRDYFSSHHAVSFFGNENTGYFGELLDTEISDSDRRLVINMVILPQWAKLPVGVDGTSYIVTLYGVLQYHPSNDGVVDLYEICHQDYNTRPIASLGYARNLPLPQCQLWIGLTLEVI